jgi:hypothetical protein
MKRKFATVAATMHICFRRNNKREQEKNNNKQKRSRICGSAIQQ